VVDNSVVTPVSSKIAADSASDNVPFGVRNGRPDRVHSRSYSSACLSRMACTRALSSSAVLAVEKRKLKSMANAPGITLFAPVPAWMFDICHDVGK
jgi:hypothetical protein